MHRFLLLALPTLLFSACPKPDGGGGPAVERCEIDLAATGLFSWDGAGATAKLAESEAELIGGQWAHGEPGDVVLRNDRIRVVIQKVGRNLGPQPYGGNLIDGDLVRPEGEPGRDQLGKLGVLYAFGRTSLPRALEILSDGSSGGPAVVAATGEDTVNDYINVQNFIHSIVGSGVRFLVDPEAPLPLRITTYYVLSPGEGRVRMLTAFCNTGSERVLAPVGDLMDRGGSVDFFNPEGCTQKMGTELACIVEPASWFGFQGEAVAYGLASFRHDDHQKLETSSAVLTVAGISASLAGGEGSSGVFSWVDPEATRRPGAFVIPAGGSRTYLRDLLIGRDLGAVSSNLLTYSGAERGALRGVVRLEDGRPAAGARVQVSSAFGERMITLLVADEAGAVEAELPPGSYQLVAGLLGHASGAPVEVQLTAGATADLSLSVGAQRLLRVEAKDPFGAPLSVKVVLVCPAGPCPTPSASYRRFYESEVLPSNVAAIGFVPPTGYLELPVAPGEYEVVVSRGPEYSLWPDTWPARGAPVDLRSGPGSISATLARVVDTVGWMSSDLHVHSVNSPDASVRNELRVLNFAAEGVDVLCSTDHDYVTDFAPMARAVGAEGVLATMVGEEVTPFDWGHYNAFPLVTRLGMTGGAIDGAGGEGPTLRPAQMIAEVKGTFPSAVVQMNHPRGPIGSLSLLKVDTATLASHAEAARLRMEPAPDGTPEDSRLFSADFDALEVQTGLDIDFRAFNDWMTFLSYGTVRTATATSDTHQAFVTQGGYPRTYVEMGSIDEPSRFDPALFAQGIGEGRAVSTNGPFLRASARRLDALGQPVGAPIGVGGTLLMTPSAGESVRIDVEIQAPEWMSFDHLELYTHAPGREAFGGVDNPEWPESRVLQRKALALGSLPLEPVVVNGQTFRRIRVAESFTVAPTADAWYVVMLRSTAAARPLFPLSFAGVECSAGSCVARPVRPFAFTNALFVDADGSGAYDRFPAFTQRSLPLQLPPRAPLTERRFWSRIGELIGGH